MDLNEADLRLSRWGNKLMQGVADSHSSLDQPAQFASSPSAPSQPPQPPARRKSLVRSCDSSIDAVFGGSWAGDATSSWDAGRAFHRRLSESLPQWLSGGTPQSGLLEAADSSTGANEAGVLDGTVMLRGTLEDQHLAALQAALAEAMVKVLAPLAGLSLPWSSGHADDEGAFDYKDAPCSVWVSQGTRPSNVSAEFGFKIILCDPNDLPAALELLRLEAQLGGAKRLLPQVTRNLGEVAGRLSLRLDVAAPERSDPCVVAVGAGVVLS